MGKNGKKDLKARRTKKAPVKGAPVNDLPVKNATGVKGGRKAGETPLEYMKVTLSDVLVSGV
jgi:hypothetical protein